MAVKKQTKAEKARRKELIELVAGAGAEDDARARRLIDEIIFLEGQMATLRALPHIAVNPKNPEQQRSTPAAKLYKECLQQYNNSMRLLLRLSGDIGDDAEDESPLRAWIKSHTGNEVGR